MDYILYIGLVWFGFIIGCLVGGLYMHGLAINAVEQWKKVAELKDKP